MEWINVKRSWEQRPGSVFHTGCKPSKFQFAHALSRLLSDKYFTPMFRSLLAQYIGKPLCSPSPFLFLSHVSVLYSRFTHHCILSMHTLVVLNPRWIALTSNLLPPLWTLVVDEVDDWDKSDCDQELSSRIITTKDLTSKFDKFLIWTQGDREDQF